MHGRNPDEKILRIEFSATWPGIVVTYNAVSAAALEGPAFM